MQREIEPPERAGTACRGAPRAVAMSRQLDSRNEPLMPNKRPRREDRQPGETFRDTVGRYLCSYGHRLLNTRHLAGEPQKSEASAAGP